jgi:hypothetical protein
MRIWLEASPHRAPALMLLQSRIGLAGFGMSPWSVTVRVFDLIAGIGSGKSLRGFAANTIWLKGRNPSRLRQKEKAWRLGQASPHCSFPSRLRAISLASKNGEHWQISGDSNGPISFRSRLPGAATQYDAWFRWPWGLRSTSARTGRSIRRPFPRPRLSPRPSMWPLRIRDAPMPSSTAATRGLQRIKMRLR